MNETADALPLDIEKFRKVPFAKRTHCSICEQKVGEPVISWPKLPMTEIYVDRPLDERLGCVDQYFHVCANCGHGQIANVLDVTLQYGHYRFRASESSTGRESAKFFLTFLDKVMENRKFKVIVELGCNDLHVLKALKSKGERLIGIDPILKGREKELSEGNISAIGDFFENVALERGADLVLCKDALEHVDDPKNFVKKVVDRSSAEALFVFQFPLLETLLAGCRFDQIFHQHLNYYSLNSIVHMLDELGCELTDYTINYNLWGSILIAFKKGRGKGALETKKIRPADILSKYEVFKSNMSATDRRLSILKEGETPIYGYGAALMLPLLDYHLKNGLAPLECVIDDDRNKEGLSYINLPVSIRPMGKINNIEDSVVLITAIATLYNMRSMLSKMFALNPKQIIVPINTI